MALNATLNFRKVKVGLNATYRIFLTLSKVAPSHSLIILKKFTVPFLNYKPLKLQLRVFLLSHTVAIVTYFVMERTTTCSPIDGQFFDTMIVASSDKEWL